MESEASRQAAPPSKRRRIALACNACRIRKSKCNGAQPRCALCENLGFDCQYEPTESASNVIVRKELLTGLEQRLKELEASVKRHEQLLCGGLTNDVSDQFTGARRSARTQHGDQAVADAPPGGSLDIQLEPSGVQEVDIEGASDGMAITLLDEQDSGYFGPSSNISFMRHIFRAMSTVWNIQGPTTPATDGILDRLDNGIISASRRLSLHAAETPLRRGEMSSYNLPPETELESRLKSYFENTGFLFPFIHPPSFLEMYQKVKSNSFTKVQRTWLGLLNMILAIATSADDDEISAVERISRSDIFYGRAVSLCNTQMLRGTNIEIVQYLLLMSQYLQGTQKSVQTWIIHGLAVKAALSLGLQSESLNSRCSIIEQEVRRRTWYGCIMLDRNLSATFGRPSSIPEEYVRVSMPTDWNAASDSSTLSDGGGPDATSTLFFSSSINLYKILHNVLGQLYDHNLGCGPAIDETELSLRIFHLEHELGRWKATLDTRMSLQSADSLVCPEDHSLRRIARCQNVLTLRYLHLEILLHRPCLVKALDRQAKNTPREQPSPSVAAMAAASTKTCVNSAESIISIVNTALLQNLGKNMLGAWWFTLFYVFNAALIVFANFLIESSAVDTAERFESLVEKGQRHLLKATASLKSLDRDNRIVDKCQEYIEYLSQSLEKCLNQRRGIGSSSSLDPSLWQQMLDQSSAEVPPFDSGSIFAGGSDLSSLLNGDLELGQFFVSGNQ